jgi:hypothetical protein
MKQLETGDASQTSQDSAIENLAGKPQFYTSVSLTWLTGLGREGVAFSFGLLPFGLTIRSEQSLNTAPLHASVPDWDSNNSGTNNP